MERRSLDPAADRPLHRSVEHVRTVVVHPEDEAGVDHHAGVVQAQNRLVVVAADVVRLPLVGERGLVQRLEADEEGPQSRTRGGLDQPRVQHGLDGSRRLPHAASPAHAGEQVAGEPLVRQQVVVEEVEVPSPQGIDLSQRAVDGHRVEGLPADVEGVLVAEVAGVRATAGDHEGVRHEVARGVDQVATGHGRAVQRPGERPVAGGRPAGAEVGEEGRPRSFAGAEHDRVGVQRRLLGQGGRVKPAEYDVGAARAVEGRELVGAMGRGDVGLDRDDVRRVVGARDRDVLVADLDLVVGIEVGGQRHEPERREERVLDRTEVRVCRFLESRQDQLDLHDVSLVQLWEPQRRAPLGRGRQPLPGVDALLPMR